MVERWSEILAASHMLTTDIASTGETMSPAIFLMVTRLNGQEHTLNGKQLRIL